LSNYIDIPDFDTVFTKVVKPVVLNDVPYQTEEDRAAFNSLILTTYESDVLGSVPTCACGHTKYGFKENKYCDNCNTPVTYPAEGNIDMRTWIRVPDGIDGFIVPEVWVQLNTHLGGSYSIMEYLTNSRAKVPSNLTKESQKKIKYLESIGWERGLNYFIRNFDKFLEILPILTKNKALDYCYFLKAIRNKIFPKYLPVPTKAMLIVENTQTGAWADKRSITGAIDACRTIANISMPRSKPLTDNQIETKVVSVIANLVAYHVATIKGTFCLKKGWFRGQLYCSRSHFCMRAVITSLNVPHSYSEIHVPWAQGLEMLKVHIVSKLMQRNFSSKRAYDLVENSGNMYNKLIDEIIQELINEGPEIKRVTKFEITPLPCRGIMVLFQRNLYK